MSGKFMQVADLNAAKRETEIFNSRLKRGEIKKPETITRSRHVVCECGDPGCVFISHTRTVVVLTI